MGEGELLRGAVAAERATVKIMGQQVSGEQSTLARRENTGFGSKQRQPGSYEVTISLLLQSGEG